MSHNPNHTTMAKPPYRLLHPLTATRRITLLASALEELSEIDTSQGRPAPDLACTMQLFSDMLQDCWYSLHPLAEAHRLEEELAAEEREKFFSASDPIDPTPGTPSEVAQG